MAEATYYSLIEDLERFLRLERDEGTTRMEVDRAILEELALAPDVLSEALGPQVDVKEVPRMDSLEAIAAHVTTCFNCPLCKERKKTVPGMGNANRPDILFVGDGPREEEDELGLPFVGRAGELLTKMIEAMGYQLDQVFITNSVKCRLPKNRAPMPEELKACLPYLQQQIELLKPKVIVALGASAVKGLVGRAVGISRLRGQWHKAGEIDLMPTYHPSYLLRDPSKKREVWQDLQSVLERLGKQAPPRAK